MCKAPYSFWATVLVVHKLCERTTSIMPGLHLRKLSYRVLLLVQMWSDLVVNQVIVIDLPVFCQDGIITVFALLGEEEGSSRSDKSNLCNWENGLLLIRWVLGSKGDHSSAQGINLTWSCSVHWWQAVCALKDIVSHFTASRLDGVCVYILLMKEGSHCIQHRLCRMVHNALCSLLLSLEVSSHCFDSPSNWGW